MKFVKRENINTSLWNQRIAESSIENIFCYSWYLDATAQNWGALISDDKYETILPLPYTTKLGKRHLYQPIFTREINIFGEDFDWNTALTFIKTNFAHISFRTNQSNLLQNQEERVNQELKLSTNFAEHYKTNAKRLIKKGHKNYVFENSQNIDFIIDLFSKTVGKKVKAIGNTEKQALKQLMQAALQEKKGELLLARNHNGKWVAGGFFLKDKDTVTYLKGAATEEAKKNGAMYALFDNTFKNYAEHHKSFDFGGSAVKNVAAFYKKFGATDRNYYNYTLDNTSLLFKAMKSAKGLFK